MAEHWRISPDVSFVDSEARIVALNLARLESSQLPATVQGVGAVIWRLIEEQQGGVDGCTLDGLVSALAEMFVAEEEQIRRDTETFLRELAAGGYILAAEA